ncbi:MAG: hypothetical protein H6650_05335 [Ardenticatenales bacterium]|nr:hypothetical protein [Ardenticatenales bacterium]
MSISQQLAQLLSASPGSLVFHLVTLFALQTTLALAWGEARQARGNEEVRRLAWAAGVLLLARLGMVLAAGIFATTSPDSATTLNTLLPPLEQSLNALTILALCWALTPPPQRAPRLLDASAGIYLLLLAITTIFFTGAWYNLARQGNLPLPYNASPQTFFWGILQLTPLLVAQFLIWRAAPPDTWLRLIILGTLTLGHVAHLWNYPESFPAANEIPYWIRLGQLIALPLLAAFTYRANLRRLLQAQMVNRPPATQLAAALRLTTPPLAAHQPDDLFIAAARMIAQITAAPFVAVATPSHEIAHHLVLHGISNNEQAHTWWLKLADWPALSQVMTHQQSATLSPDGRGARQLFHLYQELGISGSGILHMLPLPAGEQTPGIILVAAAAGAPSSSAADLDLLAAAATYLGSLLARSASLLGEREITILRQERDEARQELAQIRPRLAELERHIDAPPVAAGARVEALEAETEALRAALAEAEEAVSLAAAQVKLSPEWVMRTVTRYSAELEEAQSRIQRLQEELADKNEAHVNAAVVALAQELRSPMMVIAGYTELLLSETIGGLNDVQRDFLRRIKGSSERMGLLLQQIIHTAEPNAPRRQLIAPASPTQAITEAIDAITGQIRQKSLRLYLDLHPELPPVNLEREQLYRVVAYLLENACRASVSGGAVRLRAQVHRLQRAAPSEVQLLGFLHLSVADTGKGIPPQDRAHVFRPHLSADDPLIAGLGETGVGLFTVRNLVLAQGGRVWVDSEMGEGSTFTVLLPILAPPTIGVNGDGAR